MPPIGWPGELTTEAELLREMNPQIESDREAHIVIKQCQRLTIRAALPVGDCTDMPIFASGDLDVPQATQHDLEALLYYPGWVKLNYEGSAESGPGWYENFPVCAEGRKPFTATSSPSSARNREVAVPNHAIPHGWVKLAMLGLNLVVWMDAVARLA